MAENSTSENVNKGLFRPWDIVVYALIAAFIVLAFVFMFNKPQANAFEVCVGGERVLSYSFTDDKYVIYDAGKVKVLDENVFEFICDGGHNVLTVYPDERDAAITDADCAGKECTAMRLKNGTIICAPHDLTVKVVGRVTDPIVG